MNFGNDQWGTKCAFLRHVYTWHGVIPDSTESTAVHVTCHSFHQSWLADAANALPITAVGLSVLGSKHLRKDEKGRWAVDFFSGSSHYSAAGRTSSTDLWLCF